jgi:hypothetical protein
MRVTYTHDGREVWVVWHRIKAPGLKNDFQTERCNIFSSTNVSDNSIILYNESIDFNTFIKEPNVKGVKDYQWCTHAYMLWKGRFGEALWRHEDGRKGRKRKTGKSGLEENVRVEDQEELVNIRPAKELKMFAPTSLSQWRRSRQYSIKLRTFVLGLTLYSAFRYNARVHCCLHAHAVTSQRRTSLHIDGAKLLQQCFRIFMPNTTAIPMVYTSDLVFSLRLIVLSFELAEPRSVQRIYKNPFFSDTR